MYMLNAWLLYPVIIIVIYALDFRYFSYVNIPQGSTLTSLRMARCLVIALT